MNEWQIAAAVLLVCLGACGGVAFRSGFAEAVVAVQLAGTLTSLTLLLIAEGELRQPFADLALVLSVVSFAGTILLARYLAEHR